VLQAATCGWRPRSARAGHPRLFGRAARQLAEQRLVPPAARLIAHVDMDAFFAAVEVRDHPEYRGRPVVVGAGPHARGVVAAASYEARRFGVHSAMPSRRAFALCPSAVFLPPDMARYRAESDRLFELLETFTPRVEPISVDEAFLDLTGCPIPGHGAVAPPEAVWASGPNTEAAGMLFGHAIQRRIHEQLELPASVGVAPNKFLAKLASELAKPDGLRHITRDSVQTVLDPLPVQALWGVGAEGRARLEAAGIATVGALRRMSPSSLRAVLGFAAERLLALSGGEDDRPVEPAGEPKSIGRETTFDRDTRDGRLLARTLRTLCEDVARRLRADGFAGRIVTLKIRWEPFDTVTRRTTLALATDHGGRIAGAASKLWDRLAAAEPIRRVRLIGISVSGLERPAAAQLALYGDRRPDTPVPPLPDGALRFRSVDRIVDAINERFGSGTVEFGEANDAVADRAPDRARRPEVPRQTGRPAGDRLGRAGRQGD
jgi:DNA polymerase IV